LELLEAGRFSPWVIAHRLFVGFCFFTLLSCPAFAGTWNPDPSLGNVEQHQRLYEIGRKYCEQNFDADANLVGAATATPPNKRHHATGNSADYAFTLLLTGDPADRELAQKILRRVVTLQDTNPQNPTCGAYNWTAEDKPQDLNSAAFVGLALAGIIDLDRKKPCLDADVRTQVENSVHLAVEAVMRRQVNKGYTNIAFLSAALASAGQKFFNVPGSGAWAETKLDGIMELTGNGEFTEYLSPTYTGVAIDGAYACKHFAFSDAFSAKADNAINHLWKQVSLAYDAPTYQLGGPYCRAYGDNMIQYSSGLKYWLYLALDGAYPLPDDDTAHDWAKAGLAALAATVVTPRPEFKQTPPSWRAWTAVGSPGSMPDSDNTLVRHLYQYRNGNFILGTVAAQDEWKQKRHLVAYWASGPAPTKKNLMPAGFKVGMCLDESCEGLTGVPGEQIHFYSQQVKNAAIVALATTANPAGNLTTLVFDENAEVDAKDGSSPLRIKDGSITAYLYPVTNRKIQYAVQYKTDPMPNGQDYYNVRPVPYSITRVMRFWDSCDGVGNVRVMSYLIVFKPSDQPPPAVTGITLGPGAGGITASAKVDGVPLSVAFQH
jgi:hypothetical protein